VRTLEERYKKKCEALKKANEKIKNLEERVESNGRGWQKAYAYESIVERHFPKGFYEIKYRHHAWGDKHWTTEHEKMFAHGIEDAQCKLKIKYDRVEIDNIVKLA
jgi:hypothetical protein